MVTQNQRKFSPAQVREIRRRFVEGEGTAGLAREFGVAQNAIHQIVILQTYKDVSLVDPATLGDG